MSAALRGDFERLRKRGVASTLSPAEDEPEPRPSAEPHEEHVPTAAPEDEPAPGRSSVFGRLFGR
jgi:hypothetical protein